MAEAGREASGRTRPEAGSALRARLLAVSGIGIPTLAFLAHAAVYGRWIVDDAGITFAYARNIAEGHGIVQQPGAPTVEGFSNPLWLLLHVIGHGLGLFDRGTILGIPDYIVFPKALGVACFVGILVATTSTARAVLRDNRAAAAAVTGLVGLGLAVNPSFVLWSVSGLENPLYALAAALLATLLVRASLHGWLLTPRAAVTASAIALMAALTRPDGLVLAAAHPALALLLVQRTTVRDTARSVAVAAGAFALPFGLFLAWRYATFGRLVPNTAVAKSQGIPTPTDLGKISELVAYPGPLIAIVGSAVVGLAAARPGPLRGAMLAIGVPLGLTLLAFGALEADWMTEHRFATPVWVLGTTLAGLALVALAQTTTSLRPRVGLAGLTAAATLISAVVLTDDAQAFSEAPTVPLCLVTDRFGRLFNTVADDLDIPEGRGSLLLPDLGGTLLTSRLAVYDLAGLTDATIADAYHDGDMERVRDYVFDEVRPTFIHTHGAWTAFGGLADPRLHRDYIALTDSDWVRRDATPDGDATDEVEAIRDSFTAAVDRIESGYANSPRRSCGSDLDGRLPT